MKKYLLLAGLLAMGSAHADWMPGATVRTYTATITYGGGSRSIDELKTANGPLRSVAEQVVLVPARLEDGLNTYLANLVNSQGAHFISGSLTGAINASVRPQASGIVSLGLNGFNYSAFSSYSGTKFGIISYACQNSLRLRDIAVTAQYGAVNGAMGSDVGLTFVPVSNTDCDTNLGWIIPGLDRLVDKIATKADRGIETSLLESAAKLKDSLFFARDQNFLIGLNKLIPLDTNIALPNGGTFALGQYVQNNLVYLLANSQIDISVDRGAVVVPTRGINSPGEVVGQVVALTITTPGTSFTVSLKETADVRWTWKCNISAPTQTCAQP